MKTNIALIGFMGTGKTAVGQALADKLGMQFIELDSLIERKAGMSIPDIFEQDGEITFRELEIEVTSEVAGESYSVIACGGGLVLNKINIDRLRENAIIIYLTATPDVILNRVSNEEGQRPLLDVENPVQTVGELLEYRKPFYERAAEITIDSSKMDIDTVVEEIINKLDKENQDG